VHLFPSRRSSDLGPRTTPAIDGDRIYTLGAERHLKCLKVENGDVVWEKKLSSEQRPTPLWGFAGHPLVDGEKIICTTSGKVMSAFNKHDGELIWEGIEVTNRQFGPGYAPPVIYSAGGVRQLIAFPPDALVSLDPETGKEYWRIPINPPVQNGVSIATPMKLGDILVASSFYSGTLAVKLEEAEPKARVLYKRGDPKMRRTEALQTLMSTPVLRDGHLYGICAGGELRCIDLKTGDRLWETTAATLAGGQPIHWTTAFIIPNGPEKCFIANDQGELVIANLTPKGYEELSRAKLLNPTNRDARRPVLWCHPAFANKSIYWRNDKEMICVSLEKQAAR
jgi:outer membrane protein assembly factor BamB